MVADDDVVIADTSSGPFTVTLPSAVTSTKVVIVKKLGAANTLTVASAAGTIDGSTTIPVTAAYTALSFVADGANWMVV